MGRPIEIESIGFHVQTTPCANHCRYCQLGRKYLANITFARFKAVVDRFAEWREARGLNDLKIVHWVGRAHNYDLNTLKGVRQLGAYSGWRLDLILLGGLVWRPDDEMRTWLLERRNIGIKAVVGSFMGHGRFHDRWSSRPGDFDFQMRTLRVAADLGMELRQRLFLANSTIPLLDELIGQLDALPGKAGDRCIYLLFYRGRARRLEEERITRETLDGLPAHLRGLYRWDWPNWRSEQEWLDFLRTEEEAPEKVMLLLELDDANIDRVESMTCDEIWVELEGRTRAAYAAIPSRAELAERYGDPANRRIYMFRHEIERKWLDLHLAKHPVVFERELTHLRP